MLVFHATVPIDPERREEAIERASAMAAASRTEEGVIDYRVAVDVDDPNLLCFFEQYSDESGFEAHLEADHYREFMSGLADLLTGEPAITRFEVASATEVEL